MWLWNPRTLLSHGRCAPALLARCFIHRAHARLRVWLQPRTTRRASNETDAYTPQLHTRVSKLRAYTHTHRNFTRA
eukprot:2695628-Lingulodinium_polyedra.AAC.1